MRKHRVLWVLGILLLAGAGVAAALFLTNRRDVTTSSQAAYEAFQQATLDRSRFYAKEARLGFAKALELDPDFAMAMLSLAELSEREQAITLVRRAERERDRLTPRERYHVDMAAATVDGKPEKAFQLAHELHAKFPGDQLGAMVLAREALSRGDRDEAIRRYQELLAVNPNYSDAYNQIGYYYGYRGDYDRAIDSLEKYRFISRDNANPFDSLGENQAYSGHYNEAIENLNRALAIKPDFSPAYQHLAVAYEGLGQYAKAEEMYEKAATFDDVVESGKREFLTMALRASLESGDRAKSLELLDRIDKIPTDPRNEFAHIGREFMAAIRDLVENRPADAERRLNVLRPEMEARWDSYSKAGKMTPGFKPHFPEWNYAMAIALEKQGRTDEALALYEKNANPPNPFIDFNDRRWIMEARAKVAEIIARKGDLDRAEKLIAENRKWNPSWAPCRPSEEVVAELRRAKVLAASK
ncbi:MAG TPA: tetratricopeptide repeat protein [Thermoanaerobaculia bacterium]|nr:tetratricopeptide repeat protein [Thermoanaerobaculia bacterium]